MEGRLLSGWCSSLDAPLAYRLRLGDLWSVVSRLRQRSPWLGAMVSVAAVAAITGLNYLVSAKDRYQGPVRTVEEDEVTAGL